MATENFFVKSAMNFIAFTIVDVIVKTSSQLDYLLYVHRSL